MNFIGPSTDYERRLFMLEQSQERASIRQDRADLYDKLRYDLAVRMEQTIQYSVSELRMLKQQLEQGRDSCVSDKMRCVSNTVRSVNNKMRFISNIARCGYLLLTSRGNKAICRTKRTRYVQNKTYCNPSYCMHERLCTIKACTDHMH